MRRRLVISALASMAVGPPATAQQAHRIPIVGFLHPGFPDAGSPVFDSMGDGLGESGYVVGKTVRIDARWALGKPDRLPQLARELVQQRVAILVATGRPSIEAARAATTDVPIIANDLESDPIASGYVSSLARPGSNLTGHFLDAPTLCGKWLQQIRDIVPELARIGILWDATTGIYQLNAIKEAARAQAIDLFVMEIRDSEGLEQALGAGLRQKPQAVIQLGSPLIRQAGPQIAQVMLEHRMPGTSQFRTFTDGGGLLSYGPDLPNLYRNVGVYVAKVLQGARPGELPIVRPNQFELVVNLKTARALQLTIPRSLLNAANDVID